MTERERLERHLQRHPSALAEGLQLAQLLGAQKFYAEAVARCEQLLAHHPQQPLVWAELGGAYLDWGRWAAAEAALRIAAQLAPGEPEHRYNLAVALQRLWRLEEAESLQRHVVAQRPDHDRAWVNLGGVLSWLARHDEEQAALERAVALAPDNASARWNLSLSLLRQERWAEGWRAYEARYRVFDRPTVACTWDGTPRPGSTLWLFAEQGLGDTLQFVRFVPQARARVGRVVLVAQPALVPLLRTQALADEVVAQAEPPAGALTARLMSLPHLLGLADAASLGGDTYLTAPETTLRWSADEDAATRCVALAWQGSRGYRADALRSPPLAALRPLLQAARVRWCSVQRGDGTEQLDDPAWDVPVTRLPAEADGAGAFVDTAGLLTQCAALVTSDTAVAHLAGALGVPTCLLLAHTADWRWGVSGDRSPWYASLRLCRQTRPGDWGSAVRQAAQVLASWGVPVDVDAAWGDR